MTDTLQPSQLMELRRHLQTLELDIGDLEETVRVVEANPYKYKLEFSEVRSRKAWVERARAQLERMKLAASHIERGQTAVNERQRLLGNGGAVSFAATTTVGSGDGSAGARNGFVEREMQQQQMIMQHQDEQLDGVMNTMYNLKDIAHTMGRELEDQTGLLEELDMGVDNTAGRLGVAQNKMNEVMKAAKGMYLCTCVLSFVDLSVGLSDCRLPAIPMDPTLTDTYTYTHNI